MASTPTTVRIDTVDHSVSPSVAGNAMLTLDEIGNRYKEQLSGNDNFMQKVRPPENGSFMFIFEIHTDWGHQSPVLVPEDPILSRYLKILAEYFSWKIKLAGSVPDFSEGCSFLYEEKMVQVDPLTAEFLIPEHVVSQRAASLFKAMNADEHIRGISVLQDSRRNPIVAVDREEFPLFAVDNIAVRETETQTVRRHMELIVESPVLSGRNLQWRFIHGSNRLGAKIRDEHFLRKVIRSSEQFSNGDKLNVTVESRQEKVQGLDVWIDKHHTIVEVHSHIPYHRTGLLGEIDSSSSG